MNAITSKKFTASFVIGLQKGYSKTLRSKQDVIFALQKEQDHLIISKKIYLSAAVSCCDIMNFKNSYYFKVITLMFLCFACNNERNSAYYELKYDLPEYFEQFDFKVYAKENNINLRYAAIDQTQLFYKDSLSTTFLSFKRNDFNDITEIHDFERLVVENEQIIKEEKQAEWIGTKIGKREGYDFYLYQYRDTILKTYGASFLWSFENHSIGIGFSTDENNKSRIKDFKNMIDNVVYNEPEK